MGQMTHALVLGCKIPKLPRGKMWDGDSRQVGDDWVYENGLLDLYGEPRGARVRRDETLKVIGFSVAVGASGEDGVPYLDGPIDLASIDGNKRYAKSIERARKRFDHFAAFCKGHGVTLPDPRLWLVEFEVA